MNASEKVKFISNWIKNYVDNMPSKAQSLVIGISGASFYPPASFRMGATQCLAVAG